MRKVTLSLTTIFPLLLLISTRSLYIEISEMICIIVLSVAISFILGDQLTKIQYAWVSYILFWLFSLLDLGLDHYIFFYIKGFVDGQTPTLVEKISESSGDLFLISLTIPFISYLMSFIYHLLEKRKRTVAAVWTRLSRRK